MTGSKLWENISRPLLGRRMHVSEGGTAKTYVLRVHRPLKLNARLVFDPSKIQASMKDISKGNTLCKF
jgi:hypothetical protein